MKAAVLHRVNAPLAIEEITIDPPRRGEVLVRLAASGVCRSDLHMVRGVHAAPLPIVLGHEGAGVVEEVGEGVKHVRAGDHVVLTWMPRCGRCRFCASGRPNLCDDLAWSEAGLMRDGTTRLHRAGRRIHHNTSSSFAERTVVSAETAIRIDPAVPLQEAALLGCAVMTGIGAVLNTARVREGESVLVLGCGGVGLSIVQGAAIARADPIVAVDVAPARLDLARELGATHAVRVEHGREEGAARTVLPEGADYVFEALGDDATLDLALRLTGRGGTTVLVGLARPDARVPIDPLGMVFGERTIAGCLYGSCVPDRDVPRLLDLCGRGMLRLDRLVGDRCGLDDVNGALERLERGEGVRTVIVFP